MPLKDLLSASGGLYYHLSALRHSKPLWAQFRKDLADTLAQWDPPQTRLTLIGPSGGHCLDPIFLEHFKEIHVVEPDPLARFLLKKRFAHCSFVFEEVNRMPFSGEGSSLGDRLDQFFAPHRDSALLFCNLLGQVGKLLGPQQNPRQTLEEIAKILSRHPGPVASFHDLYSGLGRPHLKSIRALHDSDDILNQFADQNPGLDLVDHLTKNLFSKDWDRKYFMWQFRPDYFHIVEWVQSEDR